MSVTKTWKVYGNEGHSQALSFGDSFKWDFSNSYGRQGVCIIECQCSDKTGTNDYVIFSVTADTAEACEREFMGQLSDGAFENCRVGKVEEVDSNKGIMRWKVFGEGLDVRIVVANSFDEAIEKCRKINSGYVGGQIL